MSDKEQFQSLPVHDCKCVNCGKPFYSTVAGDTSCCNAVMARDVTPYVPQRDERQTMVLNWMGDAFGVKVATNVRERIARFLEEALELAQAEGMEWDEVNKLVAYVMSRPPGNPDQEVGGVSITLLAYCAITAKSADGLEVRELMRILSKDPREFAERQNRKAFLGVGLPVEPKA